ncbi:MAG: GTPase HflX [Verrucomicrobiales bacterium]|nr:GTPase HflX [Verrucomicrobiales bacterium]
MFEIRDKPRMVEKALLIGVHFDRREQEEAASLLVELRELVETLGLGIADAVLVRAAEGNARYLMGKGKAQELILLARNLGCDCIVFDNELTPVQQRIWETEAGVAVIDREEVILDIFAMRAKTREARLQVELARMQYSLPRLTRMWGHLDRQGGAGGSGAGAARGEGESQLEIDRRLARKRIDVVKRELETVRTQRSTQRKERVRVPLPHGAIVGYTNAGKSTLLNRITGADVLAEDRLFATLDTTTRKLQLPDGQQLLVTDTVGFIRRLPHRLVESFKATLEEAGLADFLIHVLDASLPKVKDFFNTTMAVLEELGAAEKNMLIVLNKIDLVPDRTRRMDLAAQFHNPVLVSLHTGEGMEDFLHRLGMMILDKAVRLNLRIPQSRMDLVALIHREGKLISQEYDGNDLVVTTTIPRRLEAKFADFSISTAR